MPGDLFNLQRKNIYLTYFKINLISSEKRYKPIVLHENHSCSVAGLKKLSDNSKFRGRSICLCTSWFPPVFCFVVMPTSTGAWCKFACQPADLFLLCNPHQWCDT